MTTAAESDLRAVFTAELEAVEARAAAVLERLDAADQARGLHGELAAIEGRLTRLLARLERAAAPARERFGGGGAGGLVDAVDPEEMSVRVDPTTDRWQAVKRTLRDLVRAYVENDIGGVLRLLAADVVPDSSVFFNAIKEDYEAETNIALDLELLRYRLGMEESCVDLRWNRNATRMVDGGVSVDRGTATFCFSRDSGMKLSRAQGRLPFGLGDPQLQKQASGGQLNPDPENPNAGTLAVGVQTLVLDVDHRPGGRGNVAFVDLETGRVRKATSTNLDDLPGEPGEDFYVATDLQAATPDGICFHHVNGTGVVGCDGGFDQPFSALREIDTTRFVRVTDDVFGYHFGVRTTEGNFAFVRVPNFRDASFKIARSPIVQPEGSQRCP